MPQTCEIVEQIKEATSVLSDQETPEKEISGEIEFLVMTPGTHLKRHCGTTNQRLTLHLAIDAPKDGSAMLRVGALKSQIPRDEQLCR